MTFKRISVCISGGMDPIHIGHIHYIQEAAKLGDELTVILNSDRFLMNKKGYVFMDFSERKELLESIKGVDRVFQCIDLDDTVCKSLAVLRPDIFCKGGADRGPGQVPEEGVCKEIGIKLLYGVGGVDKPQSSSWLVERAARHFVNDIKLRRGSR